MVTPNTVADGEMFVTHLDNLDLFHGIASRRLARGRRNERYCYLGRVWRKRSSSSDGGVSSSLATEYSLERCIAPVDAERLFDTFHIGKNMKEVDVEEAPGNIDDCTPWPTHDQHD